MIRPDEAGKVNIVIVKDMFRMGRAYPKVGYYIKSFFADRALSSRSIFPKGFF